MANIPLNKSEIKKQNDKLKTYKKFLPSLELKRKQIIAELNKARKVLDVLREEVEGVNKRIMTEYPMVADEDIFVRDLIKIGEVETGVENIVGITVPYFKNVKVTVKTYELLATPFWLDSLSKDMRNSVELRFKIKIQQKRIDILEYALRKTTQRVNLFDKVLIPETKANIRKIKIYLSDYERASVVQAKIAKSKNQAAEEAQGGVA